MHRFLLAALVLALISATAPAEVVRGAPDFSWLKSGNNRATLKSLRGQPVVLVVASSPRQKKFRAQVKQLQKTYQLLGNTKAVMAVAFTEEPGVIRSNIPFVLAANPAEVAARFDVTGPFAIFVIGKDGNMDEISDRVLSGQRVLDIINNSYVVQSDNRRSS
ncbi:MAG: peroxiredoxin family protein [Chthoniobacterales bacterium]|jgi:peroxiredoxin